MGCGAWNGLSMSEQELEMWLGKLRLFLTLHGGPEYWENGDDLESFCGRCPYLRCVPHPRVRGGCAKPLDVKGLWVKDVHNLDVMHYGLREHWCAEWIKHV